MTSFDRDPEPLLYSVEQAIAMLGFISRSVLYERIASGELKPTKVGRRTFFTRSALQEFVDSL